MNGAPRPASPLGYIAARVPDASFAVVHDVQRAAAGMFRLGTRCTAALLGAATRPRVIGRRLAFVETRVDALAARGSEQRHADALRLGAMLQRAEPVLVEVLEHVVELLPIDALLARVDVDALISRVQVDALISRVDVDAVVGRVDVDAVVARVDLQRIAGDVLAGIELGDLIHDSTTGVVSDVRDTVRSGAASADRRLARVVDRIVRRGRERDLVLPAYAMRNAP